MTASFGRLVVRGVRSLPPCVLDALGIDSDEVVELTVTRSEYTTSFPIDDVTIELGDGRTILVVRKDLSWDSLIAPARLGKPAFLHDPRREASVYAHLLPLSIAGPPRCYGVAHDGAAPRWLYLERLDGVELFQVGDLGRWKATARWLARFHSDGAPLGAIGRSTPLLRLDDAWWELWAERAMAAVATDRRKVRVIESALPLVLDRLGAMPATLVHGEFYASNVLVGPQRDEPAVRIAPVDWEMAAVGPGLVDLAALTSGRWKPRDRRAIEQAYFDELGVEVDAAGLLACRIACGLQWLGWMPGWRPPEQQAHDWLTDVALHARQLRREAWT